MNDTSHIWEAGRPGRFRWLLAMLYVMLTFLAVLQLLNPGSIQRIAAERVGTGLLAALCALLLVSSLLGIAAGFGVRAAAGAREQSAGDAVLHISLAAAGSYVLFGGRYVSHAWAELILCVAGLCTMAVGALMAWRGLRASVGSEPKAGGEVTARGTLWRSLLFMALGAPLVAQFGSPWTLHDSHVSLFGLALSIAATAGLAGYAAHLIWYAKRRPVYWL